MRKGTMAEEREEDRSHKRIWDGLGDVGCILLFVVILYLISRSCRG